MDLRRLSIAKPYSLYIPITRLLTHVTSTVKQQHDRHFEQPPPPPPPQPQTSPETCNQHLLKLVSSLLSNPSLDLSKCKPLMSNLCPHEFDRLFLAVRSNVNPKTALHFFYYASKTYKFRFTVRSCCLLIRLLLFSNLLSPARLLLIRLIDGQMPSLFANNRANRHVEITVAMVNLNVVAEPVLGFKQLIY
ncbi:hypothetical protein Dsin_030756 [Dipteronia sinensis]|uniref:Uncharacterized protein n=1 Tax=Dipteronia sinensis TaxID=43782 RepID=A0AAE0DSQ5_9ROSI|nr:hypothetical protein Dsin_030756 [Dipteronia sinensis]